MKISICIVAILVVVTGCGGRGGYIADKSALVIEDRIYNVQRVQDEESKQSGRIEQRVFQVQQQISEMKEQLRDMKEQLRDIKRRGDISY